MKPPDLTVAALSTGPDHPQAISPKRKVTDTLGSDLVRLGVLATLSMGAALVINQLREPPLPLIYASKETRLAEAVKHSSRAPEAPSSRPAPLAVAKDKEDAATTLRIIGLEEFMGLVAARNAVVLDARPEIFHRLGHVPGALSLSREEFERDYAARRPVLESRRGQPIAVYCSSASCEDSQMVADALIKLGYRGVLVFKGGWDEWTQAGGEEEKKK